MTRTCICIHALLIAAGCFISTAAFAQPYPSKPVRIIVPFPPGQAADTYARVIANRLTPAIGQPVVVDNRPGAGAALGTEIAAKSPPDGYTLLVGGSSALAINPHLYRNLGYNTLRDFAALTQSVGIAYVFVVHPSLYLPNGGRPVTLIRELVALAKAKPDQLAYGSSGSGSTSHLVTAHLAARAGVTLNHVPYKGALPALIDLIAGQVMLVAETMPAVMPHVQSKKIRPIAVSVIKRIPQLPDVPTVDEQGIKGYDLNTWMYLVTPVGTPLAILDRLSAEIAKIIAQPEMQKRLVDMGFIPAGSSREQFGAFLEAEYAKWGKIVQASGAKVE